MAKKGIKTDREKIQTSPEKTRDRSSANYLTRDWLVTLLFFVLLTIPNIVFSGSFWYESIYLMKWVTAFVPVGILTIVYGLQIVFFKNTRDRFSLDPFGAVWLLLILFVLIQPLWASITSWPSFIRAWFFLASLWSIYFIALNKLEGRKLVLFLWGASLSAALNVIFAEIQIRGLQDLFPFIYQKAGSYFGNTIHPNLFGIWLGIGMYGSAWLFLTGKNEGQKTGSHMISTANMALFSIIAWGLWNSSSRSAILSFATGLLVLILLLAGSTDKKPFFQRTAILVAILAITFSGNHFSGRSDSLVTKTKDIFENFQTIAKRDTIWATSGTMFLMHPATGVGLGHFKWNYLDAQRKMLQNHPDMNWGYTYWAHNEVFQWFCETGAVGGLILLAMGGWWLFALFRRLRRGERLSDEAIWACGFLFLIWFNALWTRPFHRIEDAVWMALAFALANREILTSKLRWPPKWRQPTLIGLGTVMAMLAISGLIFLGDGMAGDRKLRLASSIRSPYAQKKALEDARHHLMVRDIVEMNLAYFFYDYANFTEKQEDYIVALDLMYSYFSKRAEQKELPILIDLCSKTGNEKLLSEIASYYKLGSYLIDGTSFYFFE